MWDLVDERVIDMLFRMEQPGQHPVGSSRVDGQATPGGLPSLSETIEQE
jgi:hypothetical protein